MRTLVIGGTGTVGKEVVKRRLAAGEDVFIMAREVAPHHPVGARIIGATWMTQRPCAPPLGAWIAGSCWWRRARGETEQGLASA